MLVVGCEEFDPVQRRGGRAVGPAGVRGGGPRCELLRDRGGRRGGDESSGRERGGAAVAEPVLPRGRAGRRRERRAGGRRTGRC